MELTPMTLTGRVARLAPLAPEHAHDLFCASRDENIWRLLVYGSMEHEADMHALVQELLRRQERGTDLPFTVVHRESGGIIGCTRYMNYTPEDRGVEIGGTWYTPAFQRTAVNTECKYLLLRTAFERLGCLRVQFKTDLRNERSQRAIERLGAVKEGVLRNHMILPDGTVRHSVFYSVIVEEWPQVKARLEGLLGYSLEI